MEKKLGIGTAVGKIILMGEHSVVYGEPALSMPFPITKIKTTISENMGEVSIDCYFYKGLLSKIPENLLGTRNMIEEIFQDLNKELVNIHIDIENTIPPGRGMGSSAAVSISITRAIYNYFKIPLSKEGLIKWSNISERFVHGNPSGLDSATIAGERPLYYIKGKDFNEFTPNLKAYLIVGDTGEEGDTREAVEGVRKFIELNPNKGEALIKELGNLARESKYLIENNKPVELGENMSKAHKILDKLTVSNNTLNNLVNIAIEKNALGAKLTGGGRGGCIIALASNEEKANSISDSLLNNGAKDTWIYNMEDINEG